MKTLHDETGNNFSGFDARLKAALVDNPTFLNKHITTYQIAYKRIVSLQAWRSELLEKVLPVNAMEFYLEGQNDALSSLVSARVGIWRSALMSLRSSIENVCFCLYYKDHPVELALWEKGRHKLGFSEILVYMASHPHVQSPDLAQFLADLKKEYSTLSLAVHGSSRKFRMSAGSPNPVLWNTDIVDARSWATRQDATISLLNQLLLSFYCEDLKLARNINLRKAIGLAASDNLRKYAKQLSVNIPKT